MSSYKIHRWDAVLSGNSNDKRPMIYIKPDTSFVEFAKKNNFKIVCQISGTNLPYDGVKIVGMVNRSCDSPSCRPNFYNQTGYYVVTLLSDWYGYPTETKMGEVKFYGLPERILESIFRDTNDMITERKNKKTNGLDKKELFAVVSVLGVILVAVLVGVKLMKK